MKTVFAVIATFCLSVPLSIGLINSHAPMTPLAPKGPTLFFDPSGTACLTQPYGEYHCQPWNGQLQQTVPFHLPSGDAPFVDLTKNEGQNAPLLLLDEIPTEGLVTM